jgi:amidophosphoribosyltransferase
VFFEIKKFTDNNGADGKKGARIMCGIIGGYNIEKIILLLIAGGIRLQHRGHDSAGAVVYPLNSEPMDIKKNGRIGEIFTNERVQRLIDGTTGILQNKYSTTGGARNKTNRQPFTRQYVRNAQVEFLTAAHNGNFTDPLFGMMETTSDSELPLKNFEDTDPAKSIEERIFQALGTLHGAFSLLFIHRSCGGKISLIAARDPHGFRPLCYGRYNGSYVFASESVALNGIGAEFERFVEPGEIIVVDEDGLRSYKPELWRNCPRAFCIFEYIYFAHPCSRVETPDGSEKYVWQIRRELGKRLAINNRWLEERIDAICPIPNSATVHGIGLANAIGLPLENAIIRNEGSGRTFIAPSGIIRNVAEGDMVEIVLHILRKFSFLPGSLIGRRACLVDDSIVRGNTMKCIVELLKKFNSDLIKDIFVLVASAPIMNPCVYGIRITNREELAYNQAGKDAQKLSANLGAKQVVYLSKKSQSEVVSGCTGMCAASFCQACFNGRYPTPIENMRSDYRQAIEG